MGASSEARFKQFQAYAYSLAVIQSSSFERAVQSCRIPVFTWIAQRPGIEQFALRP